MSWDRVVMVGWKAVESCPDETIIYDVSDVAENIQSKEHEEVGHVQYEVGRPAG